MRPVGLTLSLALIACAPSRRVVRPPEASPRVVVRTDWLTVEEQVATVAYVESVTEASEVDLSGWTVRVDPYPVALPRPVRDPFDPSRVLFFVTSYADWPTRTIGLSWRRGDGVQNAGDLDVEDLRYELDCVRCGCEAALRR